MLLSFGEYETAFTPRSAKREVFIVDDEFDDMDIPAEVLGPDMEIIGLESASAMFSAVYKGHRPEMIFLDTDLSDADGFEVLEQLKTDPLTKNTPVVMVTAKHDQNSALKAIRSGAVDFLPKPFLALMLPSRVNLHLKIKEQQEIIREQERVIKEQTQKLAQCREFLDEAVSLRTGQMSSLQSAILQTVSDLVTWPKEGAPTVRGEHQNMAAFLEALYERGITLEEGGTAVDRDIILQSARLHDVGKLAIESSILNKPGRLTTVEFEAVKKHPLLGVDMLGSVESGKDVFQFLKYAKVFAGTHHERWDGTGYPLGLRGAEIPLPGRVMAIADVYEGLTRVSPWKKPFPHEMAVRKIIASKGTQFDPVLVDVFADVADTFCAAYQS
jgi:putative two-component system response regulator